MHCVTIVNIKVTVLMTTKFRPVIDNNTKLDAKQDNIFIILHRLSILLSLRIEMDCKIEIVYGDSVYYVLFINSYEIYLGNDPIIKDNIFDFLVGKIREEQPQCLI